LGTQKKWLVPTEKITFFGYYICRVKTPFLAFLLLPNWSVVTQMASARPVLAIDSSA